MATRDLFSGLEVKTLSLRADADGQPVSIPDAHFLFTAEFERSGQDLVMSNESGQTIIVTDYFAGTNQVDLAAPNGALLRAGVVESLAGPLAPGQYAQAGTPAGAAPIGQVETLQGTASVQRTDGTKVTLKIGDPVFQGDVVSTAGSSKVGITFIDQTVFTLSEDARMVLDELVYSPGGSDNSMLVNLVQGTFVFIAGEVAPTGDMKVQTPVATMGIRGTTVISKISATDGTLTTSLDADPDGKTGSYQIIDTATNKVLAVVTETDQNWIITAPGAPGEPPTVTVLPRTNLDFQLDQPALAFVYQTYTAARARFGKDSNSDNNNNDGGGPNSVPGSGIDSGVDGSEFTPLDGTGTPGNPNNGAPSSPDEEPSGPPQGLPDGSNDQSQGITPGSEGTLVTTDEDTPSGGIDIPVTPPESEDQIDITIVELPIRGLLLFQGTPVAEGETIAATSTDDLTFSPNGEFEELNSTDVAPLQFLYTVSIGSNVSAPVVGMISVPGVNDDPVAVDDSDEGFENEVLTIDVLNNDTDVDRDDNPTNFTLLSAAIVSEVSGGTVAVVGNQLQFDPGSDFDFLNVGDSAEVEVEYTMEDDEGAQSTGEAIITVTGQNDAPVALNSTLETTVDTPGSSQLQVFDLDDNETAAFTAGPNGPQHGTVVILPDGAFTYTPSPVLEGPPFQGFDEFEFIVTDGNGASSTGTVTVEVDSEAFESNSGQTISFGISGDTPLSSSNPALDGIGIANVEVDLSETSGTEINVSFAFDASGSLGTAAYNTQLGAIQTAVDDIIAQFGSSQTIVNFQFIRFASGVTTGEYVFDPSVLPENNTQTFNINNILSEFPFTGGGTNFNAALDSAESFFDANPTAAQSFLFFTSDGQPSSSSTWPQTASDLDEDGVIISAFGIGPNIQASTLDQIDNTGGSENVATANDLSDAFSGTPIFAAELVSFSLNLVADGVNQGEIATESDLTEDGINFDLLLANIPDIGNLLGEENQFTAEAVFDFDGDDQTTGDQITLFSAEALSAADTEVMKTGTSGNDLLLGGVLDDEIDGAGGDDVILGFAGDDELKGDGAVFLDGGADNDKLQVTDDTFKKVDGGTGQDTLVLDNTDLNLNDFDSSQIAGIESIDLIGSDANTLTLSFDSITELFDPGNAELDAILDGLLGAANAPDASLVVDGGSTDTVVLEGDASGAWTLLNETAFAGYDIYAFQDLGGSTLAAVAIDDDVTAAYPPE